MKTTIPTRFHKEAASKPAGLDPATLTFSDFTRAKAARFVAEGRVTRVRDQRDLWTVRGDHGIYRVRYDRAFESSGRLGFLVCTCPLSEHHCGLIGYCSHSLAVLTLVVPTLTQIGASE
jgi:hypothetical protein